MEKGESYDVAENYFTRRIIAVEKKKIISKSVLLASVFVIPDEFEAHNLFRKS